MDVYRQFIHSFVVPSLGNVPIFYQRKPILRVVLPGSVAPTQFHCDADYFHDSNEINFWVPLTRVCCPKRGEAEVQWQRPKAAELDIISFFDTGRATHA